MSDASDPILEPMAEFVAYEAEVRFPMVEVPTELLDWLRPRNRPGNQEDEGQDNTDDSGKRKEQMIEGTWSQYSALLEREGYSALTDLLEKLETRRESEVRRYRVHKYWLNDMKPLREYFADRIHEWSEETPVRKIIDSAADFDRELPIYHEVTWTGPGGEPEGQDAKKKNYQGQISPAVKGYDVPEYELPSVEFAPSTTLGEIDKEIERKLRPRKTGKSSAEKLKKLIRFRLRLLQRFLWTYEVSGTVQEPTVQKIPQVIRRSPERLAHMVRVLKLIEPLHENGQPREDEWPSQPDLKEKAKDRFEDANFVAAPGSVVTLAADFLRELFSLRYEKFGDDFYVLLLEHEESIREWADEMDIEV